MCHRCIPVANGILCVGGPTRQINCGDGQYVTFEMHPWFGPAIVGKRGQILKDLRPRHPFWHAVQLWDEQGQRVTDDGRCIWHETTPEKPITEHLAGRQYLVTGWTPASNGPDIF